MLVDITNRLKRGYRYLGELMVKEGKLPDADLVFFFDRKELCDFVNNPIEAKVAYAIDRRKALAFHEKIEFAELYVSNPEAVVWQPTELEDDGVAPLVVVSLKGWLVWLLSLKRRQI